jgi:hypothetical protein
VLSLKGFFGLGVLFFEVVVEGDKGEGKACDGDEELPALACHGFLGESVFFFFWLGRISMLGF